MNNFEEKANNQDSKSKLKKGFMSMSKRDQKLLIGVLVLLVALGCYLLMDNLLTKNRELTEENNQVQFELLQNMTKINQKASLQDSLDKLNRQTHDKAVNYYGTTNQGEFIYLIDKFIVDSGIVLKSVSFNETEKIEIKPGELPAKEESKADEKQSIQGEAIPTQTLAETASSDSSATESSNTEETASQNEEVVKEEFTYETQNIRQMTANIEFVGTYSQILKLLELIDLNDKTIVSSQLTLKHGDKVIETVDGESQDSKMDGTILLRFYQVVDVEKYVEKPASKVDALAIPFATVHSPFMRQSWGVSKVANGQASGSDAIGLSPGPNTTTSTVTAMGNNSSGYSNSYLEALLPSYLDWLNQNNGAKPSLVANMSSTTVYRFDTPLKLVGIGSGELIDSPVDHSDKKEGIGSNLITLPTQEKSTLFEMEFPEPLVTLNKVPTNISFALYSQEQWSGGLGMIVENSNKEKFYLELLSPVDFSGWMEISFNPESIDKFTYPVTIKGFYFENPAKTQGIFKLDNLAVHYLTTN